MAELGYVQDRDRDAVAFLMGQAAAHRRNNPEAACVLARAAGSLADERHREPPYAAQLPDFESALPTHEERVWGKPVDERILARLDEWISSEAGPERG